MMQLFIFYLSHYVNGIHIFFSNAKSLLSFGSDRAAFYVNTGCYIMNFPWLITVLVLVLNEFTSIHYV